MIKVTNLRRRGILGVKGKQIEPGQTVEVDASYKELKEHKFVKEGWLMIGDPKKKKAEPAEAQAPEGSGEKQGE